MEISPYMLTLLLIYSFLFGMSAGAFNDISRIVRAFLGVRYSGKRFDKLYAVKLPLVGRLEADREQKLRKRRALSVLIFFQDILLFIYLGCGTVILNYYLNRGQLRLYTVAAVAAGFALYYFTLGKIVMLLSEGIIFFIRAISLILFYIISRPFILIFGAVLRILRSVLKKLRSALEKKRAIRYNKEKQAEIVGLSYRGFLE